MTPLRRGWLAFQSMAVVWLCSVALCFLFHLEALMVVWIGAFALAAYLFFALPIVAGVPEHLQLRFWYLLTLLSGIFAIGLLSLFFRESPISILTTPDGNIFGYWVIGYAFTASGLYLLRLRSTKIPNQQLNLVDKVNKFN